MMPGSAEQFIQKLMLELSTYKDVIRQVNSQEEKLSLLLNLYEELQNSIMVLSAEVEQLDKTGKDLEAEVLEQNTESQACEITGQLNDLENQLELFESSFDEQKEAIDELANTLIDGEIMEKEISKKLENLYENKIALVMANCRNLIEKLKSCDEDLNLQVEAYISSLVNEAIADLEAENAKGDLFDYIETIKEKGCLESLDKYFELKATADAETAKIFEEYAVPRWMREQWSSADDVLRSTHISLKEQADITILVEKTSLESNLNSAKSIYADLREIMQPIESIIKVGREHTAAKVYSDNDSVDSQLTQLKLTFNQLGK